MDTLEAQLNRLSEYEQILLQTPGLSQDQLELMAEELKVGLVQKGEALVETPDDLTRFDQTTAILMLIEKAFGSSRHPLKPELDPAQNLDCPMCLNDLGYLGRQVYLSLLRDININRLLDAILVQKSRIASFLLARQNQGSIEPLLRDGAILRPLLPKLLALYGNYPLRKTEEAQCSGAQQAAHTPTA